MVISTLFHITSVALKCNFICLVQELSQTQLLTQTTVRTTEPKTLCLPQSGGGIFDVFAKFLPSDGMND